MAPAAARLRSLIEERGPIPFARFMEEALYGESGYYARPRLAIGEAGDYVTGSSLSPLFARATARLLRRLDGVLGRPCDYAEIGYGGGEHLRGVIAALSSEGAQGGQLRRLLAVDRGRTLAGAPLDLADAGAGAVIERLASAGELAATRIQGLVFSYELFDALPVHRLVGLGGDRLGELWVELDGQGRFAWRPGELSDPGLVALLPAGSAALARGQIADLAPGWVPLYRELAAALERGLLVTCDYGFESAALLDARIRFHGTLACYRQQRGHRDPLVAVGEQDMTAHVDFAALRRAGEDAGLETVALTRQAAWLVACGLFEDLAAAPAARRLEAMALLDLEGMGEEIRVLVQSRGVEVGAVIDTALLRTPPAAL